MNLLINFHGAITAYNARVEFFWEDTHEDRTHTTSENVTFAGSVYGGWSAFYEALQYRLALHPEAKVFVAWSTSGFDNTTYQNGAWSAPDLYFKIRQCNPNNRNEGYDLQRLENGVWVNVHSDATNAKGLFEYMHWTIRPNASQPLPSWLNKLWISFEPNTWLGV
jgi:hypothetical protein